MSSEFFRIVRGHHIVQPGADSDHEIGILDREIRSAQCDDARLADAERMIGGRQVGRVPGRHDRNAQGLVERAKLLGGFRQTNAVASKDDRPLGLLDQVHDLRASVAKRGARI